ncbi:MAG: trimethylamine methyltransferase family protein [Gammaproteobacteria bacterium]|nr:trimethylamine methyltransferase family protein [Gammaproteobacteria bacterium]MDH3467963.1 trimethylamine methyltransferase family protein [Gammaproteobacteria bacterium]
MARRKPRRAPVELFEQLPVQQFRNPFAPLEIISSDELESIHLASLKVLSEHGLSFTLPEARAILHTAGAVVVDGSPMVKFDPDLIMESIAKAPSRFVLHARNPVHNLNLGDNYITFCTVSSPPNSTDLARGRRLGTAADFSDFLRLTQMVNVAQIIGGHPVEPTDIPVPVRHLHTTRSMLTLTDKSFRLYSLSRQRVLDVLEMVRIARNLDDDGLRNEPSVFASINPNSPRHYDDAMLWGMIECAQASQPLFITPFTLAGAMAPVSLAGALTLQNAEALAGIAFVQIVRPGTPVVYGGMTSNIDMRSGSPAFGTPETVKCTLIGGQLARRYGLPYRSSNANASNAPDVQAVYESQMSLWASLLSHANFVFHSFGWLEGGLAASFEKFIIDAEMVQGLMEVLRPVSVTPEELAVEAIGEVEPGGHFFGNPHTIARFENAFYHPFLSDWRNYETWDEGGALDATHRAQKIYQSLLKSYDEPPMNPARREALDEFVAHREEQGGAPL